MYLLMGIAILPHMNNERFQKKIKINKKKKLKYIIKKKKENERS